MDIKAYINSGVIESYVFGMLSAEECMEVERFAQLYPEVREEIEQVQKSMQAFISHDAVSPRPELQEKIWQKLEPISTVEKPKQAIDNTPQARMRKLYIQPMLAAAIIILLLTSVIANIYLSRLLGQTQEQLSELNASNLRIASQLETQKTAFSALENQFAFIISPDTRTVQLAGLPTYPEASAVVYWNNINHEVFIVGADLPPTASDKQYQLWAIVDGSPVSAGLLDSDNTNALQKMASFKDAQAFAITLEPKGGSVHPTLEAMIVLGPA